MIEAADRLHKAPAKTSREITAREVDAMARYIARRQIERQWRERGHKRYDHSFKQLCEAADALIKAKPELVGLARIALEGIRSSRTGIPQRHGSVETKSPSQPSRFGFLRHLGMKV